MAEQIVNPEYAPAFSISAEGKDITRALQECLSELTLTDNGGATAKADELKITLISQTLPLPSKGARLRVAMGFNDQLVDKGWFVVSGVGSTDYCGHYKSPSALGTAAEGDAGGGFPAR